RLGTDPGPADRQRPDPDQRPGHAGAVLPTHDHQPREAAGGRRPGPPRPGPDRRPGLGDLADRGGPAADAGDAAPARQQRRTAPGPAVRDRPAGTARRAGRDAPADGDRPGRPAGMTSRNLSAATKLSR